MAFIKQSLGKLTEAVEEYLAILQQSADYVPALKGMFQHWHVSKHVPDNLW